MTKELNISWDGKIQSRIVGADTLSGIAGLLSGEQEIYVVFDKNVAWVSDQIVSRIPVRAEHIWRAAGIKADIVSRDPYEKGERMKLNLGHTFAHAIEHEARLRGDDITHGEAVSIGIILAAELSEKLGVAQNGLSARLKADFTALGLPVDCPYPADVLRGAMHKDKKATARALRFVLLEDIARPRIVELTDF